MNFTVEEVQTINCLRVCLGTRHWLVASLPCGLPPCAKMLSPSATTLSPHSEYLVISPALWVVTSLSMLLAVLGCFHDTKLFVMLANRQLYLFFTWRENVTKHCVIASQGFFLVRFCQVCSFSKYMSYVSVTFCFLKHEIWSTYSPKRLGYK